MRASAFVSRESSDGLLGAGGAGGAGAVSPRSQPLFAPCVVRSLLPENEREVLLMLEEGIDEWEFDAMFGPGATRCASALGGAARRRTWRRRPCVPFRLPPERLLVLNLFGKCSRDAWAELTAFLDRHHIGAPGVRLAAAPVTTRRFPGSRDAECLETCVKGKCALSSS